MGVSYQKGSSLSPLGGVVAVIAARWMWIMIFIVSDTNLFVLLPIFLGRLRVLFLFYRCCKLRTPTMVMEGWTMDATPLSSGFPMAGERRWEGG